MIKQDEQIFKKSRYLNDVKQIADMSVFGLQKNK